jgi:hypothetical protein
MGLGRASFCVCEEVETHTNLKCWLEHHYDGLVVCDSCKFSLFECPNGPWR